MIMPMRHLFPGQGLSKDEIAGFDVSWTCWPRCGQLDISYGQSLRQRFDLFLPENPPKGLFVFVHGGYWLRFDKSDWSHFAQGPLAHGWAVAMPSYDLCPSVSIAQITRQISQAIMQSAARIAGPLILAGHSAGGHLVARMACADGRPEAL